MQSISSKIFEISVVLFFTMIRSKLSFTTHLTRKFIAIRQPTMQFSDSTSGYGSNFGTRRQSPPRESSDGYGGDDSVRRTNPNYNSRVSPSNRATEYDSDRRMKGSTRFEDNNRRPAGRFSGGGASTDDRRNSYDRRSSPSESFVNRDNYFRSADGSNRPERRFTYTRG